MSTESDTEPLPPRRALVLIITALVVFTLDLVSKVVVLAQLDGEEPVRVLGGLVYLQIVRNPGAAFSIATGMTWVLALVACAVVVAIIWILPKLRSTGWALGLGLVLAGALGNLVDRFFRAPGPLRGHVIDFVSLFGPDGQYWPVFNVADSAIVCGGILIVVMALLGREYDGRSTRDKRDGTGRDGTGQDGTGLLAAGRAGAERDTGEPGGGIGHGEIRPGGVGRSAVRRDGAGDDGIGRSGTGHSGAERGGAERDGVERDGAGQ